MRVDYGPRRKGARGRSLGFGRAVTVARAVGLEAALRPMGLEVEEIGPAEPLPLPLEGEAAQKAGFQTGGSRFHVARLAMESDLIVSVPRVEAHAQMLVTLSVKNCFGCVRGFAQGCGPCPRGTRPPILCRLPCCPVGRPATRGRSGRRYNGHAFDRAEQQQALCLGAAWGQRLGRCSGRGRICRAGPEPAGCAAALCRRKAWGSAAAGAQASYPCNAPADFCAAGFQLPAELSHTSFHPTRFVQSCFRRIFAALKK